MLFFLRKDTPLLRKLAFFAHIIKHEHKKLLELRKARLFTIATALLAPKAEGFDIMTDSLREFAEALMWQDNSLYDEDDEELKEIEEFLRKDK